MSLPILDLLARLTITAGLLTGLWKILSYVWGALVERVKALEAWRTKHEDGHVNVLLELQQLTLQAQGTREIVEEMKGILSDVAAIVNLRKPPTRRRAAGALP
ncbi:hypothetical protein [Geothrix campi]|uniref:hypothetical protein n=1 Tax=Geothrix campi TaxID=2966450 RepID=UPI00214942D2|nr:hypothetical protein [Geothrix sp. SG10]